MRVLAVGSRGGALAFAQTRQVLDQLARLNPNAGFRIEIIKTQGDRVTDVSLAKIGEKGLFVKEIEAALLPLDTVVTSKAGLRRVSKDIARLAALRYGPSAYSGLDGFIQVTNRELLSSANDRARCRRANPKVPESLYRRRP